MRGLVSILHCEEETVNRKEEQLIQDNQYIVESDLEGTDLAREQSIGEGKGGGNPQLQERLPLEEQDRMDQAEATEHSDQLVMLRQEVLLL